MSDQSYLKMCLVTDSKPITLPRSLVRAVLELAATEDGVELRNLPPHQAAVLEYVRDQIGDNERKEHLNFLVPYLHFDGENRNVLSPELHDEAMSLLDGFGELTIEELRNQGLTWDWSHVRDSTVEALAQCRGYVESVLSILDTRGVLPRPLTVS